MTVTDRASTPPSTGATPVVPVPPVLTPDHPAEREDTGVTLRRAFAAGASLTVLVLLVAIIAGSVSLARLTEARQALLDEIGPAVRANQSLEIALLNQETGIRGYALTRNAEFLAPYRDSLADEAAAIAVLRDYLGGRPEVAQVDERGAGGAGLAQRVRRTRDRRRVRRSRPDDRQDAVRRDPRSAGRPLRSPRHGAGVRPGRAQQRGRRAAVGRDLHRRGDRRLPRRRGVGPAPRGPRTGRGARRPGARRGVGRRAPGGPGQRAPGDRRARCGRRRDAGAHLQRGRPAPAGQPAARRPGPRPGTVQPRPRAVRLRREPRPAGAAAQGLQLLPAPAAALRRAARRAGRPVHRLRRRRRAAHAAPDQRPARLLPRRPHDVRFRHGGPARDRPGRGGAGGDDACRAGRRDRPRRPAPRAGRPGAAAPAAAQPVRQRAQVPPPRHRPGGAGGRAARRRVLGDRRVGQRHRRRARVRGEDLRHLPAAARPRGLRRHGDRAGAGQEDRRVPRWSGLARHRPPRRARHGHQVHSPGGCRADPGGSEEQP